MQLSQINTSGLISLTFKDIPVIPTSHHWLSWYFKCFFADSFTNVKPSKHFMLFVRFSFNQLIFDDLMLSFCSTTSAGLEPHQASLGASALLFPLVSHPSVALKLPLCKLSSSVPHFISTSL